MIGSDIVELTFSEGCVYKECYITDEDSSNVTSKRKSDNCVSIYSNSESKFLDNMFPLFAHKQYDDGTFDLKYY